MTLQFEGVGFGTGTGSGGKIGTVVLVAMGSQPSTPYTVGSKWFYNGKIYTATTTTAHDSGVVPSYDTAYLFNGTYYYWDGSALQGADESNLVHISGTETITGNKTFSGTNNLGDATSATTQPTSDTSDKVATTKFVKDFAQDGEWQKPADWIDIRSGALDNSVYFLVAHSKPTGTPGSYVIADYAKFNYSCGVSTSGNTFDVFVDGIKIATQQAGIFTIDWAELYNNGTILGGYDVMHPSELTTHIVRITPSVDTDTIATLRCQPITGQTNQGVLWIHFELEYIIKIIGLLAGESSPRNLLCEAITAKNDRIKFRVEASGNTGLYEAFNYATSLVKIPVLEAENNNYDIRTYLSFNNVKVKKVTIKNNSEKTTIQIMHNFKGETMDIENPIRLQSGTATNVTAGGATILKNFPAISKTEKGETLAMSGLYNCESFVIDEGFNDIRTLLRLYGTANNIVKLKGLIVNPNAPFDYATAPQINISYTAMDRAALVRLFNSMPTVSDGQVINVTGATGASDLTADDITIATGKGWSVTR